MEYVFIYIFCFKLEMLFFNIEGFYILVDYKIVE